MRTGLFWSGGKDGAWACQRMRSGWLSPDGETCEVVCLLSTYDVKTRHVPHQDLPVTVLERQAHRLDLPLLCAALPHPSPNSEYERRVLFIVDWARKKHNIEALAFGDVYLSDIRSYRERIFGSCGMPLLFPMWLGSDAELTAEELQARSLALAQEMIAGGLKAKISSVYSPLLSTGWLGRNYDAQLLKDLPAGVDPCGEHGEFHTQAIALPGVNFE